jgi:D-alanyl-D-alanine carboxypeptidase-like protein
MTAAAAVDTNPRDPPRTGDLPMTRLLTVALVTGLLAGCTPGSSPLASPAARAAEPAAAPTFSGTSQPIDARVKPLLRWSWRRGCPVPLADLRLLRADHWGFDGKEHRGAMVVHKNHAARMLRILKVLFDQRYPIARMQLVDVYKADDDRSMAANNTSAFNCRKVSGSTKWSEHAFGRALDLNPVQNPYVTRGGRVSPPNGRPYADRSRRARGMIHSGDAVQRAFAAEGWRWGGYWSNSKDYQHFSSTGR